MKWIEIKIITTQEASDAVAEALTQAGANGVAIQDPFDIRKVVETPGSLDYADAEYLDSLGEDVTVCAYFPATSNKNELGLLLTEKLGVIAKYLDIGKGTLNIKEVDEEDWSENWKQYYKPLKLTERIVIKPSWESYNSSQQEIVIEMDPGMAFGTGTHDTTRMCAILLDKHLKKGQTVLDVGCGSGILAIIAAKLGAEGVTAVDIDEMAARIARENCARNNVTDRVFCSAGELKSVAPAKTDVIVANIIASVIIDLAGSIPAYAAKDGLFITSGIIRERSDEVKAAYLAKGFKLMEEIQSGEWVAMVFRCQDSL